MNRFVAGVVYWAILILGALGWWYISPARALPCWVVLMMLPCVWIFAYGLTYVVQTRHAIAWKRKNDGANRTESFICIMPPVQVQRYAKASNVSLDSWGLRGIALVSVGRNGIEGRYISSTMPLIFTLDRGSYRIVDHAQWNGATGVSIQSQTDMYDLFLTTAINFPCFISETRMGRFRSAIRQALSPGVNHFTLTQESNRDRVLGASDE